MSEDNQEIMSEVKKTFKGDFENYLNSVVFSELIEMDDYIKGTKRLKFYRNKLENQEAIKVINDVNDYEESLYSHIASKHSSNLLLMVGGIGSGKTTACVYLKYLINSKRNEQKELCKCNSNLDCGECYRKPITINCIELSPEIEKNELVNFVYNNLRYKIFDRLVKNWISTKVKDENEKKRISELSNIIDRILRRLIIVNDVSDWSGGKHDANYTYFESKGFILDNPVFSEVPTYDYLHSLIKQYKSSIDDLGKHIIEATNTDDKRKKFITSILKYYVKDCCDHHPQNLIIIDNLDAIPTDKIGYLISKINQLSFSVREIPFLIPLRPSSISYPDGYTNNWPLRYHHGPDPSDMILHRLERYILSLDKTQFIAVFSQLSDKVGEYKFTDAFDNIGHPVLVCLSYIYSIILSGNEEEKVSKIRIHPDYKYLKKIKLDNEDIKKISKTLEAIVGTSARYALDQASRFFYNAYSDNEIISYILETVLIEGFQSKKNLDIKLPDVVNTMFGNYPFKSNTSKLINLYKPSSFSKKRGWPSLVKLRILEILSKEGRMKVEDLVSYLSHYAISKENSIKALNDLHDNTRLLVWFSQNNNLNSEIDAHYNQWVVISEHGLSYFYNLIGDFEYCWYCATQILLGEYESKASLSKKLRSYIALIRRISFLEWKQITFNLFTSSKSEDNFEILTKDKSIVLNILYSSLGRLLDIATGILITKTGGYRQSIVEQIQTICELVLDQEDKFGLYYGSYVFLKEHCHQLTQLLSKFELIQSEFKPADNTEKIGLLVDRWKTLATNPEQDREKFLENDYIALNLNITPQVINAASALIPKFDKILKKHNVNVIIQNYYNSYYEKRKIIIKKLSLALPTYKDLNTDLDKLYNSVNSLISFIHKSQASGIFEEFLTELNKEKENIGSFIETLNKNKYSCSIKPTRIEINHCKSKSDKILGTVQAIAHYFGLGELEHLDVKWD